MSSSNRSTSSLATRSLHADEIYVLDAYEDHAKCCHRCADPLRSANLCSRGTSLAADVAKYLCQREGHLYARRSHPGDVTDKVYLPPHAQSVPWLLEAIEQGLHLSTCGEESTGTTRLNTPSIRIIEPRSNHTAKTCHLQIYPFCSRRMRFDRQRSSPSRTLRISLSDVRVGFRGNREGFEVNLRFYPEL